MNESFAKNSLPLVLIVFTIFTVSLVENLQITDGFSSGSTADMKYDLSVGETKVQEWTIYNSNQTTHIEFIAENPGSEFFTFEKNVVLEPNEVKSFEFIVSIPADHPDNIKYMVALIAKEVKPPTEGGASAVLIAYEMIARPSISIGDNPIYTQPVAPVVVEEEPTVQEEISDDDFGAIEEVPLETIQEKLQRIKEANAAVMGETPAEATGQFEVEDPVPDFEPGPQADPEALFKINPDDSYIEEPTEALRPAPHQDEAQECDFIAWLLSLFGMAKC